MYKKLKQDVFLPSDVEVNFIDGYYCFTGPKGQIKHKLHDLLFVELSDRKLSICSVDTFLKKSDIAKITAIIGTTCVLFKNYIYGVINLFNRELILRGVGYKVNYDSKLSELKLMIGFTHDVILNVPDDIFIEISDNTNILIKGVSKHKVGQFASNIRSLRIPEVYKGNGIRYKDENIKLKSPKKSK